MEAGGGDRRGAIVVKVFLGVVALAVIFFIWSGSRDDLTPSTGPAPTAAVSARCVTAPRALLNSLEGGLTAFGAGSLRDGYGVRSGDHAEVWFVAAEIDAPGLEPRGDIGVWALTTGSMNEHFRGLLLSVDGVADEFSDWPYAPDTGFGYSMSDDGARTAQSCQEGR